MNCQDEFRKHLTDQMIAHEDKLLYTALSSWFNTPINCRADVEALNIEDRGVVKISPGYRTLFIDDIPILTIGDAELKWADDGVSHTVHVSQSHQFLIDIKSGE